MSAANEKDNELNTRTERNFMFYVNILLTRTYCHSFMALNRVRDMPAADWLSQTDVKKNFQVW